MRACDVCLGSQTGQLCGDLFPRFNGVFNAVGSLLGDHDEGLVGKRREVAEEAHASGEVVGMDAAGAVAVQVAPGLVAAAGEALLGVGAGGELVARVGPDLALVD